MDKRKIAGSVGFLVYGAATAGLAFGEIKNPKQVNDLGKGIAGFGQVFGSTATSSASHAVHIPNAISHGQYDATPWPQVEEVVTYPGVVIFRTR